MRILKRILWILLLLFVAAVVYTFYGNPQSRGIRFALRSYLRGEADASALEALEQRERVAPSAAAPESSEAEPGPAPVWAAYQGPASSGIAEDERLELPWPEDGPRVLWRAPVGRAYSSLVIGGGRVVTLEQRRDEEALVALDLETGGEVWSNTWSARFEETLSHEGPRSSPLLAEGRVVAVGAEGEVRCVALDSGETLWRRDLLEGENGRNLTYGLAASPILVPGPAEGPEDDLVIVLGGSVTPGGSVQALELSGGERRWGAFLDGVAYSTPLFAEIAGRDTLVVMTGARAVGLDAADGSELWSTPWEVFSGLSCTQPVALGGGRLLFSAGYGKGSRVVEVRGTSTETRAEKATFEVEVVWSSPRFKTRYCEPVVMDGLAFGLDEGILACIDVATGRRRWKRGRYGYGQVLVARGANQGFLIVQTEDGDLVLLPADGEERDVLRRSSVLPGGYALNLPALAHGRLLVRNQEEVVCIDLRPADDR